jgi:hypothetical protein
MAVLHKKLIRNDDFICKFSSLLMESRKSIGPSVAPDVYDKLFTFLAAVMRCSLFCIVYLAFCNMLACMVF